MSKKKLKAIIQSYGIYESWANRKGGVPKILKHTKEIPAKLDTEFGYVLKVTGGRGQRIDFVIEHPPFKTAKGDIASPFKGVEYIKGNEFLFFLGDSIWEPIEDKRGTWRLVAKVSGTTIADMSFNVI